nr:MAG TPA: hypothetical protein [Inoviridae sp.]
MIYHGREGETAGNNQLHKISVLFSYFSRVKYFVKRMAKNHKITKIA